MSEGHAVHTGFVVPLLRPGMRVLDVGCRGAVTTASLGTATHPVHVLGLGGDPEQLRRARRANERAAVSTTSFASSRARALAVRSESVDVVYAHGVLDREPEPMVVLAEFLRVLRPGGLLALSTPDWSRTRVKPKTANVDAALRGWNLVRRREGGDPAAGRHVEDWVRRAGFRDIRSRPRFHSGNDYRGLALTIENELAGALRDAENGMDPQLASAARSAWMWVRGGQGEVSECWVETIAAR
ncbi:SAM-dependent methyltransferase [Saccharomonospora piscinae]|uniref:SAM-dependent methyltransferase n=1 Tax=Saccharomonospora piscinae TaxID=687388 RepID=A0A1V9A6Y5_SACPI|nr:class I SAM-dependent methyltransferase [Saccharomonospora piscinae]OQO92895.1 SAM-dependent methyltransferase [Saccharomonospora piscinae]TLW93031.1 class I SAM-dependent methyltransferase [Saccharomonospora piscinae]